jgi:transcriptional regulator with XRE-family HTH domain
MLLGSMQPTPKPPRFDKKEIGSRVRARREAMGLSAAALGEKVGLEESTMLKKEKGVSAFTFEELTSIADLMKAPTLWPILEWKDAWWLEQLLPPELRAATSPDVSKPP